MTGILSPSSSTTHNLISHITLDDNLVLALGVLANARTRGKLGRKELCRLLQVDAEQLQVLDMGSVFALGTFAALDDDLGGVLLLGLGLSLLLSLGLGLGSVGLELLLLVEGEGADACGEVTWPCQLEALRKGGGSWMLADWSAAGAEAANAQLQPYSTMSSLPPSAQRRGHPAPCCSHLRPRHARTRPCRCSRARSCTWTHWVQTRNTR